MFTPGFDLFAICSSDRAENRPNHAVTAIVVTLRHGVLRTCCIENVALAVDSDRFQIDRVLARPDLSYDQLSRRSTRDHKISIAAHNILRNVSGIDTTAIPMRHVNRLIGAYYIRNTSRSSIKRDVLRPRFRRSGSKTAVSCREARAALLRAGVERRRHGPAIRTGSRACPVHTGDVEELGGEGTLHSVHSAR